MSKLLDIEVSSLAARQIKAAEAWWRRNRTKAPNAIREELERAASLIVAQPHVGALARNVRLPRVRRLHLARIRYHLYYRLSEPAGPLEILALWHASRGTGPPI